MAKLTPKQIRFVEEYLIVLNATQAAIRAGYSQHTAKQQGSRLLTNAAVRAEIERRTAKVAAKSELTLEKVLVELARIAFSDIRKVVKWGNGVVVKSGDDKVIVNGIAVIPSDQIDDDTAAAIAVVSQSAKGALRVKLHDKRAALVDLGRHLGLRANALLDPPAKKPPAIDLSKLTRAQLLQLEECCQVIEQASEPTAGRGERQMMASTNQSLATGSRGEFEVSEGGHAVEGPRRG